ncbi:diacylglycerol/lipid kinase family protein [Hyphococcus luteus]|nr:diacylglycerol kinase family protein [Marinicaulis flavus]
MKASVFINTHSGSVEAAGADNVSSLIAARLEEAGLDADIACGDPGDFKEFCDCLKRPDDLAMAVIAGGDGTFAMAAEAFAHAPAPVAFLPAGTMNLITHDLGIDANLEDAIGDFLNWRPKKIDVGRINDRTFLNNVVFGDYAEVAEAREHLRQAPTLEERLGAISEAAYTLFHSAPARFELTVSGEVMKVRSNMLMIANNRYTGAVGMRPTRDRLDRGKLALYLADSRDGVDLVARVLEVLRGDIDASEAIDQREATQCVVRAEDDCVTVAVDGEPMALASPVEARIEPRALTVLCPE